MTREQEIVIEGTTYSVVISNEKEALLAGKAAKRALIGFQSRENLDLGPARYVVESLDALEDSYVEKVVRRTYGLPWRIAQTKRLLIREFQIGDESQVFKEETDTQDDQIFYETQSLSDYITYQYGFYEYGLWALTDRHTGILVGKAGITQASYEKGPWEGERLCMELGYQIFTPYRRKGYAKEAVIGILRTLESQAERPYCVYAKIDASNEASIQVALSCGLRLFSQKCNEERQWKCLYAGCWK